MADDGAPRIELHSELTEPLLGEARTLPGFSLYHDAPWALLLRDAFGWRVHALAAYRGERIAAYLPFVRKRRFSRRVNVCLPLSHDAGALLSPGETCLPRALTARAMPLELHAPLPDAGPVSAATATDFESVIDLTPFDGPDAIFRRMSSSRRRKIRKAFREGISTRESTAPGDFEIFARLQSITRRRQGAPDYPRGFFSAMARHLGSRDVARVRLGYCGETPVAGIVLLRDPARGRVIYGYGASIDDRDILATGVNPRLMWEAISQARDDGFRTFSMGSTARHHEQLLAYKTRFGAVAMPLARVYLPDAASPRVRQGGMLDRLAQPVLRTLPLPLFRRLTPILLAEVV